MRLIVTCRPCVVFVTVCNVTRDQYLVCWDSDTWPVVHQDVGLPEPGGGNPDVFDVRVLSLVPPHVSIRPFLKSWKESVRCGSQIRASEEISDQLRGINAELNSQCDLIAADERFRLFDKSRFESMKDHSWHDLWFNEIASHWLTRGGSACSDCQYLIGSLAKINSDRLPRIYTFMNEIFLPWSQGRLF